MVVDETLRAIMEFDEEADSKYNVMSKLDKLTVKRPNTVLFDKSSNKVQKKREKLQDENKCVTNAENNNEKANNISLHQQRKSLPVYRLRKKLLQEVRQNSTLILIGETGSGKTTQIPQLLLQSGIAGTSGCIGITQPRRIATVSIAHRVAQEQGVQLGELVGYCIRFENITSAQTRIKYLTDGMMVREAMTDETLSDYSVVILDEAHERSVNTDVLLGVAKRAQNLRKLKNLPPLKLLIMSATINPDEYTKYFQAPAIYLEGRQHIVKLFHSVSPQQDYVFYALATAFKIHREAPVNEDILIFLTGQEEIEATVETAKRLAKQLEKEGFSPLRIFSLYSALPTHQQLEVLRPLQHGTRKLIISTNIAETSITISGIHHVIDSGVFKTRTHHPLTGLDVLRVEKISKAQAWQRTGRAGREAAGNCYRIYTEKEFEEMKDMPISEIQRCSLTGIALQLLAIGIDITTFDFMNKPPKEGVDVAVKRLEKLGAVKGSPPQLTTFGRTMSLFPLDPRFTKVILASVEHKCLEEALTVIAVLSSDTIYLDTPATRAEAYNARSRFTSPEGDHVMLLNIFREYQNATQKKTWCNAHFLHHRCLEYASRARKQLAVLAERVNLEKASCGTNTEKLRRALLEGLYENVAKLQRDEQTYVTMYTNQPVAIHPSSSLHGTKPPLVLFTEVVVTGKCYIRDLSVINFSWLTEKGIAAGKDM